LPGKHGREDRQHHRRCNARIFLEEIGPLVYNQAVADVQERIQARVMDIDIEVHEDAFAYWRKYDAQRKPRKNAPGAES